MNQRNVFLDTVRWVVLIPTFIIATFILEGIVFWAIEQVWHTESPYEGFSYMMLAYPLLMYVYGYYLTFAIVYLSKIAPNKNVGVSLNTIAYVLIQALTVFNILTHPSLVNHYHPHTFWVNKAFFVIGTLWGLYLTYRERE